METKKAVGLEELTKEELIEMINSNYAELDELKEKSAKYYKWYEDEMKEKEKTQKKLDVVKSFVNVL